MFFSCWTCCWFWIKMAAFSEVRSVSSCYQNWNTFILIFLYIQQNWFCNIMINELINEWINAIKWICAENFDYSMTCAILYVSRFTWNERPLDWYSDALSTELSSSLDISVNFGRLTSSSPSIVMSRYLFTGSSALYSFILSTAVTCEHSLWGPKSLLGKKHTEKSDGLRLIDPANFSLK